MRDQDMTLNIPMRGVVQKSSIGNHRHPNVFCGMRAPQLVISNFVDQSNLKTNSKFSLSQYTCHETPADVENCVKNVLN